MLFYILTTCFKLALGLDLLLVLRYFRFGFDLFKLLFDLSEIILFLILAPGGVLT